jgi:hypothetical protein
MEDDFYVTKVSFQGAGYTGEVEVEIKVHKMTNK